MRDLALLVRHSLSRVKGPVLALCALLFSLQILMTLIARSFERSGQFSELARFLPDFIRPLIDPSFMAALSFSGMVCFGYSHVIVLLFLTAQSIAAGTEIVGDVESKFVDLLLARPIPRSILVARTLTVIVVSTIVAVGSMVAGSFAGLWLLTPRNVEGPDAGVLLSLALNLALLATAWGAIALVIAVFAQRRAVAASGAGLLAFALFVLDFAGRLWLPLDRLAVISPFRYYTPFPLIAGEPIEAWNVVVLALVFAAGGMVGWWRYERRDV